MPPGRIGIDAHEPIRLVIRERKQKKGIHRGKDGCRGSDPESQGEHGGYRESAVTPELADAVAHVLPNQLDRCAGPAVAHGLLDLLEAPEFCKRGPRASVADIP